MELQGPKQIKNFRMADKQRNTAHQDKSKEEKSCAIGDMHFAQTHCEFEFSSFDPIMLRIYPIKISHICGF